MRPMFLRKRRTDYTKFTVITRAVDITVVDYSWPNMSSYIY